jgi:WD40 repeat protein
MVSSGEIMSICCTRDNNYLFVADDKGIVQQFSMEYQSVLREFSSSSVKRIYSVCTSFNNKSLITANVDGEINKFQLKAEDVIQSFSQLHSGEINTLCVSKDNRCVLSGDNEGGLLEWDWKYESYGFNSTDKYGRGSSKDFDFGEITAIEINPINKLCWVGNNRGYVFLLTRDGVEWKLSNAWRPHNSEIIKIVYMHSPMRTYCDEDAEEILTCGEHEVRHWNIHDLDNALGSWSKCKDNIKDVVLGPDLKAFAFSDDKGCVCIGHFDREGKESQMDLMDPTRTTMKESWINSMVITPDG